MSLKGKILQKMLEVINVVKEFLVPSKRDCRITSASESLMNIIGRIRYVKDNVLDLIRIEDTASTTKYDIVEYQKEIDGYRIAALYNLNKGCYDGRIQYLLINEILKNSSEVIDLISGLVLTGYTEKDIKRKCLVYDMQDI